MPPIRCFDIGGTKIVAADVHEDGTIVEHARFATPVHSLNDFLAALQEHSPNNDHAMGLSIAGNIQPNTGRINCVNIPCLTGRPLSRELGQSLGRTVHVINDANAFALAETMFGAAKGHEHVLAIILGTGVGGCIVIDGKVINGHGGTGGEWGHGPASAARTASTLPSTRCQCGQMQCLDVLGSARGLERLYEHLHSATMNCQDIITAWQNSDVLANQAVDVWLDVVGGALANIVNFIDPSIVVVGGGLANSTELINALDTEVGVRRIAEHSSVLLHSAVQGPEQGLLGAAIHCRAQLG